MTTFLDILGVIFLFTLLGVMWMCIFIKIGCSGQQVINLVASFLSSLYRDGILTIDEKHPEFEKYFI